MNKIVILSLLLPCAYAFVTARVDEPRAMRLPTATSGTHAQPIVLGDSTVTLDGPWKFRTGDDARWADPAFDDSAWENVDLTPSPGANDGDVGLSGYVPGWTARGHRGYQGYAWYRIHVTTSLPTGEAVALLGPWAVDSVYQIYANRTLLGGVGDFSRSTPVADGDHYPRLFELPAHIASGGVMVIAIRVWMGPWAVATPGAGGIRIAPVIGKRDAIAARYRLQWLTIVEGYAVDAALAVLFFLMALMACCLWPVARNPAYLWLAMALVLSGIQRGNQAFFFWWEIETIQGFVVVIVSLTASLSLGAWTMAWRGWFTVDRPAWLPQAIAALTLILIAAQLLARPWLFTATFPRALSLAARYLITVGRLGFLLVFVLIAFEGLRRRRRERWHALPILTALAVVLFSSEVAAMGVRGIWFPWGIGVSLSEYASVVFDALLFMLLVRRLWADARPIPAEGAIGRNVSRAAGQIDTRQR